MKDILHYHQAAANTRYVSAGLMELMRTIHNEMEKTYFPYNFINYLPWVSKKLVNCKLRKVQKNCLRLHICPIDLDGTYVCILPKNREFTLKKKCRIMEKT